jgi:hypothetical protein
MYERTVANGGGISRNFTHSSSILGWKILFMNPMLGDLNGY